MNNQTTNIENTSTPLTLHAKRKNPLKRAINWINAISAVLFMVLMTLFIVKMAQNMGSLIPKVMIQTVDGKVSCLQEAKQ